MPINVSDHESHHRPEYPVYLMREAGQPTPTMVATIGPYLQILARISPLPVANKLLVGLGATEITVR